MEFSVVALFILFRETVEASIIVSVLMQFLSRSFPHLKKQVWWGVAVGASLAIIFGIVFSILFYVAKNNLFTGDSKNIFKGCIAWFAAILMTFLAFAMIRYKGWEEKIKRKLEKLAQEAIDKEAKGDVEEPLPATWHARLGRNIKTGTTRACAPVGRCLACFTGAVERGCERGCDATAAAGRKTMRAVLPAKYGLNFKDPEVLASAEHSEIAVGAVHSWGIFFVVLTTVLREGIESVIFLAGVGNNNAVSLILPGVIGLICGLGVGFFLYYTGKQVKDIKWVLIIMSVLLFFIAAGQVMLGTYYLMSGGMFGYCSIWVNDRPWYMQPVWKITCCVPNDQKGNEFWMLARAVFGYADQPSMLEITFYFGYWFIILCLVVFKAFRGSLFDADYKYKREMAKEAKLREQQELAMAQQLQLVTGEEALEAMAKKEPMKSMEPGGKDSFEASLPGPLDSCLLGDNVSKDKDSGSDSPRSASGVHASMQLAPGTAAAPGARAQH